MFLKICCAMHTSMRTKFTYLKSVQLKKKRLFSKGKYSQVILEKIV